MTTSGTTSFNLDLVELIEEAGERAGFELRSGYDFRSARRSMNLMFADWANRGLNMFTFEQGSQVLTPGLATYTLPADTVDLMEATIRTGAGNAATQTDITISRISVSTYSSIPNKLQQARPLQYLVRRTVDGPILNLWPVPDASQTYTLVYWRLRRIEDAGNGDNTMDVPFRFMPCMVAGLAYYLAIKRPESADRIQMLKAQYDEAWMLASDEDREKASVRFVPRASMLR